MGNIILPSCIFSEFCYVPFLYSNEFFHGSCFNDENVKFVAYVFVKLFEIFFEKCQKILFGIFDTAPVLHNNKIR